MPVRSDMRDEPNGRGPPDVNVRHTWNRQLLWAVRLCPEPLRDCTATFASARGWPSPSSHRPALIVAPVAPMSRLAQFRCLLGLARAMRGAGLSAAVTAGEAPSVQVYLATGGISRTVGSWPVKAVRVIAVPEG